MIKYKNIKVSYINTIEEYRENLKTLLKKNNNINEIDVENLVPFLLVSTDMYEEIKYNREQLLSLLNSFLKETIECRGFNDSVELVIKKPKFFSSKGKKGVFVVIGFVSKRIK